MELITLCHDCTVATIYGTQAVTNNPAHSREWVARYEKAGDVEGYEILRTTEESEQPCQHCGDTEKGERFDTVVTSLTTGGNK